jgi:hypothetical protein
MKKVIRLTESDLVRLVKRIVKEQVETSPVQSKGQSTVKYKVGDVLQLFYKVDVYAQYITVKVKGVRGGFGPGVQGPASQKNSMELDCVVIEEGGGYQTTPKIKNGDSVTVAITDVNAPLLAYYKLFKGGTPVMTPTQEIVGGKLKDIRIDD